MGGGNTTTNVRLMTIQTRQLTGGGTSGNAAWRMLSSVTGTPGGLKTCSKTCTLTSEKMESYHDQSSQGNNGRNSTCTRASSSASAHPRSNAFTNIPPFRSESPCRRSASCARPEAGSGGTARCTAAQDTVSAAQTSGVTHIRVTPPPMTTYHHQRDTTTTSRVTRPPPTTQHRQQRSTPIDDKRHH